MASGRDLVAGETFEAFYLTHADSLVIWFARRTLDAETATDLAAETLAQAYLSRGGSGARQEATRGTQDPRTLPT